MAINGKKTNNHDPRYKGTHRAILCAKCNRAQGLLDDDYQKIEALAAYRKKFEDVERSNILMNASSIST